MINNKKDRKSILFLILCLLITTLFGCSAESNEKYSRNDEKKALTKEKEVIAIFISENEEILINNQEIDYCSISKQLEKQFSSDGILKGYVKLYPNRNVSMQFVECVIGQIRKVEVDSISLGTQNNDDLITTEYNKDKGESYNPIYVRVISDKKVIIKNDTVFADMVKPTLSSAFKEKANHSVFLSFREGVSYDSYEKFKEIIEEVKKENAGSKVIKLVEDSCPFCN